MQMDEVCLLEFRQMGDVVARVGYIHAEESFATEAAVHPDNEAFPQELPQLFPSASQADGRDAVGLLVAYQHLGFYAVVLECFDQSACGYGGSSGTFGCVDYQYSHNVCSNI